MAVGNRPPDENTRMLEIFGLLWLQGWLVSDMMKISTSLGKTYPIRIYQKNMLLEWKNDICLYPKPTVNLILVIYRNRQLSKN